MIPIWGQKSYPKTWTKKLFSPLLATKRAYFRHDNMACLETNWGRKGAPGLDSNVQLIHFEIRGKCIGHKLDLFLKRHIRCYSSKLKTCRQMAGHGRLMEFRGIFEKPDYSTDSNSQKYDNYTPSENKSYFIDGRKMSEYTIQICSIVKAGLSALNSIIYDSKSNPYKTVVM